MFFTSTGYYRRWAITNKLSENYNALVCDLDGTLLHVKPESIAVPGRTRASFLSADAALLLAKISQIFPVVIATGRNAKSVHKLVSQLPDVRFSGFVLENGFVVKHEIDDKNIVRGKIQSQTNNIHMNSKIINNPEWKKQDDWDKIADLFPDWERLPFYENCAGFVFPFDQDDIDRMVINTKVEHAQKILDKHGYNYPVYKEKRKIFIYPGHVDKMKGLALLGVHPYIAIGDGTNDLEMMQQSTVSVTLNSGSSELKEIVKQKNGFCSMQTEHNAACEMLEFAYWKLVLAPQNKRRKIDILQNFLS